VTTGREFLSLTSLRHDQGMSQDELYRWAVRVLAFALTVTWAWALLHHGTLWAS
jgi:hypothetical protein